jgi:protein-S-isoprenylcysteine O-methyltransferase Ste14
MVAWYAIRFPFQERAKKRIVVSSLVDWLERLVLSLLTFGLFVLPALYSLTGVPETFDRFTNLALVLFGILVQIASLWLFWRSHLDLGANWSASLKVRRRHHLVTSGVYRYVRHPMYSSFFLLGLAQFVLIPNWLAGISGIISVLFLYIFRIRREERMMSDQFGDTYRHYCAKTARLIPWLL